MKTAKENDSTCLFYEFIPEVKTPKIIEGGNQITSTCSKKEKNAVITIESSEVLPDSKWPIEA